MKLSKESRKYFGVKCHGGEQTPKTIVLHSTEGDTAAGAAAYLHNRPDGSVHLVVDDKEAYQLAADRTVVCGAGGFNTDVFHIEQAGHSGWTQKHWLRRIMTLRRAAYWTARKMRRHNIKPRYLSAKDLRAGRRDGYTYHKDVTAAGFPTTHTDPGPHYPYKRMRALIRFYYHSRRR